MCFCEYGWKIKVNYIHILPIYYMDVFKWLENLKREEYYMINDELKKVQSTIEMVSSQKKDIEQGKMKIEEIDSDAILELLHQSYMSGDSDSQWEDIYIKISRLLKSNILNKDKESTLLTFKAAEDSLNIKLNMLMNEKVIIDAYKESAHQAYDSHRYKTARKPAFFQGKGVVYTVITGDYDRLNEPDYVDEKFDYICLTNNTSLTSKVWKIKLIENPDNLDNVRLARNHKILCNKYFSKYDYSIYVDGKLQIIGDFRKYILTYSNESPMLCFPHFVRDCAYEEAIACIQAGKDNPELIKNQMLHYSEEGYPVHDGLVDSACLVRNHHDERLNKVLECWWNEIKMWSRRDQLSFGYACWKNDFNYDMSDLFIYENEFVCKKRTWEQRF